MIKAVVFDVGGVLLKMAEQEYRQGIARRMGLAVLPAEYEENVPLLQRGELAEAAFWSRLAGRPVAPDAFDDLWLAHFTEDGAMLALAEELRGMGLRTAILSNTQASHVRLMRGMGFLEGFAPVAFSCEIGRRKPEAGAFQWVLERLGLRGPEVAYVDDMPEYVEAAARIGIRGVVHRGNVAQTRQALLAMAGSPAVPRADPP